jgi:hypothetical protein
MPSAQVLAEHETHFNIHHAHRLMNQTGPLRAVLEPVHTLPNVGEHLATLATQSNPTYDEPE